jgi:Ni,Fe-hydrogenase maturation factor
VKPDEIKGRPILTHALPLSIFIDYIVQKTGAKVCLIAIQPKKIDFGENLTSELKKTVEELVDILSRVILIQ